MLFPALQVKVWFQNRRMKWRHTREAKHDHHADKATAHPNAAGCAGDAVSTRGDHQHESDDVDLVKHETSSSSDEDEIDVVAE